MIDTLFLSGLERFNLIIRKRVTSNYSGQRKSRAFGRGMIFKDHRIYAPGDDFRAIDWKVYARTDNLMVKNYEEERNLVVHIVADRSESMNFGKPSKFEYAAMLGVGFAYLAMKRNDKFQFATFADDVEVYQPRRGFSQVVAMVDYLNQLKLKGKTDIISMAQQYKKFIESKSLVIFISDFLVPIEEIKEALAYFAGNEVIVIQVLDISEKEPQMEGEFKLIDSESKSQMRTYISLMAREEYLNRLEKHASQIKHECDTYNMNFYQANTKMPIFDTFYHVLK